MQKIEIQGIEPLQDYFFNSCFYSSLFPIIDYFGKSVIPFMINGIGTYMFYNSNTRCSVFFKYFQENNIEDIFEEIGVGCEKIDICNNLFNKILNHLKNGMPVIVTADCYYETIRPDVYLKNHLPHYLLVYGYDYEKKEYYIIEQNDLNDIRYQKKTIAREELEMAYKYFVERFYNKNRGTYWAFYNKGNQYIFDQKKYLSQYIFNLKKNEKKLLTGMQELNLFIKRFVEILKDDKKFLYYAEDIIEGTNDIIKFMNAKKVQYLSIFNASDVCMRLFEETYSKWLIQRTIIARGYYAKKINPEKKTKIIENYNIIMEYSSNLINTLLNM